MRSDACDRSCHGSPCRDGSRRSSTGRDDDERLPVERPADELGQLATVFNETLGRLQHSFDQLRRFSADASHELRTPLTAMKAVGEVGLRERRDGSAYREVIGSMLEEADRLGHLVVPRDVPGVDGVRWNEPASLKVKCGRRYSPTNFRLANVNSIVTTSPSLPASL